MTDLKAIRERAEENAELPTVCFVTGRKFIESARDVLALLDLIEKPDEKAVERALKAGTAALQQDPTRDPRTGMRAALIAAYTEDT